MQTAEEGGKWHRACFRCGCGRGLGEGCWEGVCEGCVGRGGRERRTTRLLVM